MLKLRLAPRPAAKGPIATFAVETAAIAPEWQQAAAAAEFTGRAGTSFEISNVARRHLIVGFGCRRRGGRAAGRRSGDSKAGPVEGALTRCARPAGADRDRAARRGGDAGLALRRISYHIRSGIAKTGSYRAGGRPTRRCRASAVGREGAAGRRRPRAPARRDAGQSSDAGAVRRPTRRPRSGRHRSRGVETERAEGRGAAPARRRSAPGRRTRPRLVVLRWRGTFDAPPVAFVGKGITFDTGGI